MKANIDTVIVGSRVILVPYRSEHVPRYHEWMLDEELRALTASEPLTLEEEYEMQGKWQFDEDKLTFIILSRQPVNTDPENGPGLPIEISELGRLLPTDEQLTKLPMIGDVNIFLSGVPLHLRQGDAPSIAPTSPDETNTEDEDDFYAEVEIMIAEPSFRRKGLAIEALQLMLGYATGQPHAFSVTQPTSNDPPLTSLPHRHTFEDSPMKIPPQCLLTRISDTNVASIRLFEKLGFQVTKRVEVFNELEMRYRRTLHRGPADIPS
ncbi:GNAT domain-containing protein [Flammula alnicola]|nr:GNAT domain-containing protein [Flammula alnicola]